jgi:arginine exporter protein ArgO
MPFIQGLLAGYGIAIPVGAIAILIIDASLRGGFARGFMAGAGAATADLLYAALAAVAGQALAAILLPYAAPLRVLSATVLIGIGGYGLWRLARGSRKPARAPAAPGTRGAWRTYQQFLALTLLNPLTVAYFGSLILGGSGAGIAGVLDSALFVAGAALASLSWQSLLAAFGAIARRGLPPSAQTALSVAGNLIVIGLGIAMLARL